MLLDTSARSVNLSKVFSVSEPAAWLWEKIGDADFDEPMLVDMLCGEYDVTREIATEDVRNMVRLWNEYGMLL